MNEQNWKQIKITKDGETHTIGDLIGLLEHEIEELKSRGTVCPKPINDGGPAFPVGSGDMRDYFAGQWLAGFGVDPNSTNDPDEIAECCYKIADAMLEVRTKQPE